MVYFKIINLLTFQQEADESDEEEQCALSENWTFQPEIRRWSRVSEVNSQKLAALQAAAGKWPS